MEFNKEKMQREKNIKEELDTIEVKIDSFSKSFPRLAKAIGGFVMSILACISFYLVILVGCLLFNLGWIGIALFISLFIGLWCGFEDIFCNF